MVVLVIIVLTLVFRLETNLKYFEEDDSLRRSKQDCLNENERLELSSPLKDDTYLNAAILVELESLLENIEHTEDYVRYFVRKFPLNDSKSVLNGFNLNFIKRSR